MLVWEMEKKKTISLSPAPSVSPRRCILQGGRARGKVGLVTAAGKSPILNFSRQSFEKLPPSPPELGNMEWALQGCWLLIQLGLQGLGELPPG